MCRFLKGSHQDFRIQSRDKNPVYMSCKTSISSRQHIEIPVSANVMCIDKIFNTRRLRVSFCFIYLNLVEKCPAAVNRTLFLHYVSVAKKISEEGK